MKRILSPIMHALQGTRFRRRLTGTVLAGGLLVAGFYAEENWRGGRYLDAAREEARREGVPMSLLEACQEGERKDRNLYWSPVVQRRILGQDPDSPAAEPVVAGWGLLDRGRMGRYRDVPPIRERSRRANLAAFREVMTANGWLVPADLSPAEAVLEALRRYEVDLAEWALEIRERPEWVTPAPARARQALRDLLAETARVFALRAIARAHAGRPGAEIVRDLESAVILADRRAEQSRPVLVDTVWEILGTDALTDSEWAAVQALPVTDLLLLPLAKSEEVDAIYQIERVSQPLGAGLPLSEDAARERAVWLERDGFWEGLRRALGPRGWHRVDEGLGWRALAEVRRLAKAREAAWASGAALPDWDCVIEVPGLRRLGSDEPLSSWNAPHLASCECEASSDVMNALRSRLAIAAIAAERWHRQHSAWPDSLEAIATLVPGGAAALTGIGYQTTETGVTLSAERGAEWVIDDWVLPVPEWTPPAAKPGKPRK